MIRALPILAILGAAQAQAFSPEAECMPDGAERAAGVSEYDVRWSGNGFVLYSVFGDEFWLILDDCAGQRRLKMVVAKKDTIRADLAARDRLWDAVDAALESRQQYTMGQIQAIGRDAGAKTRLVKADYVSCGCERYGDTD